MSSMDEDIRRATTSPVPSLARPGRDAGFSGASSVRRGEPKGEPNRSNRFLGRELRHFICVYLVRMVIAQVLDRPLNVQVLQVRREIAPSSLKMSPDTPRVLYFSSRDEVVWGDVTQTGLVAT